MADHRTVPGHVCADQRSVDVDNLALGDAGPDAGRHRAPEDVAEPLGAPSLTDSRQRGMIRQPVPQAATGEPATCQVHLRLAHRAPVVDDAGQEAREHQTQGGLGVDRRATGAEGADPGDFTVQPRQVAHPVDLGQHVIVGNQFTQRPAQEELQLLPRSTLQHPKPQPDPAAAELNQGVGRSSTAPRGSAARSPRTRERWRP